MVASEYNLICLTLFYPKGKRWISSRKKANIRINKVLQALDSIGRYLHNHTNANIKFLAPYHLIYSCNRQL
jgi:hypothetical protein